MKKCNVCNKQRPDWFYKTNKKKTCRTCEYRWWRDILRLMVSNKRLTPVERLATRFGYMGVAFLINGQWTVEPVLFIIGFCCVLFQVTVRKQWNLVVLQLNGLTAWTMHFFSNL